MSKSNSAESLASSIEGKVVGNYILTQTLGQGSFCKVKLAHHVVTGEKFAVKILKPRGDTTRWADFEQELRVLSGLRHPNIVVLRDILYINENSDEVIVGHAFSSLSQVKVLYVVVDLAENGELFQYIIKKGHLRENEARTIFRQMISAFEYLHAHCVVHRDLKPENILIDSNFNIKINDFGLSSFVQPDTGMTTWCGSPVYAAPEVMRRQVYSGPLADVWSLGVTLYAMVTGCLPWSLNERTNRIENVDDFLAGKFIIPSNIVLSLECTTLLSRMLVADPNKRAPLSEVRKQAWTNKGFTDYAPRYINGFPEVAEIDCEILKQMETMGYMSARIFRDVMANKTKPSVATYHTLLRRRNSQFEINADIPLLFIDDCSSATSSPSSSVSSSPRSVSPVMTSSSPRGSPRSFTSTTPRKQMVVQLASLAEDTESNNVPFLHLEGEITPPANFDSQTRRLSSDAHTGRGGFLSRFFNRRASHG